MGDGVTWDSRDLARKLFEVPEKADRALTAIVHLYSPRVEAHAKTNAPWTDRTSNARNGLFARPVTDKGRRYAVVLAHTVNYGIWLEIRNAGRYAVINPTVNTMGPQVMRTASHLFDAMFGANG